MDRRHAGFLALGHLRDFGAGYRNLGYDDTTDLTPRIQTAFEPGPARHPGGAQALAPAAYPDHILLPDGHPMLALRAGRQAASPPPPAAGPSPNVNVLPPDWEALQ